MFLVSIRSNSTRFDRFQAYVDSQLSFGGFQEFVSLTNPYFTPLETQGYNLFFSTYNCGSCHHLNFSSSYTMNDFHDIGLDKNYVDLGLGAITGSSSDNGKFKVPSLRNVALSAPYMHDGRYQTLSQVIDHYSSSIQASPNLDPQLTNDTTGAPLHMNIPDADKTALIAFLNTLTDNQMVTDPKFSNPFKVK
jgi:cytochrome c peroxidase